MPRVDSGVVTAVIDFLELVGAVEHERVDQVAHVRRLNSDLETRRSQGVRQSVMKTVTGHKAVVSSLESQLSTRVSVEH